MSAYVDLMSGSTDYSSLDRDRLFLFAISLQHEGVLPTHVANRLFRRRSDLELIRAEGSKWLETIAGDWANEPSDRVIPGWAVVDTELLATDLMAIVERATGNVLAGAIKLLTALDARPSALLPEEASDIRGIEGAAQRWANVLNDHWATRPAMAYIATASRPSDVELLRSVANASGTQTSQRNINALAAYHEGDCSLLVERVIEEKYSVDDWKPRLLLAKVAELSTEQLRALTAARAAGPTSGALRLAALAELKSRSEVDAQSIASAIRSADPEVVALAVEIADAMSESIPDEIHAALELLSDNKEIDFEAEAAIALLRGRVVDADTLKAGADDRLGYEDFDALAHHSPESVADDARSHLQLGFEGFADALRSRFPHVEMTDSLARFLFRQRARVAIRALASLPVDKRSTDDLDLIRNLLADPSGELLGSAASAIAVLADDARDVPGMLNALDNARLSDRPEIIRACLALGESDAALQVLTDPEHRYEIDLEAEMMAFAKDDEVISLLHSPVESRRFVAARALTDRLDDTAITEVLDEYLSSDSYYYNVVVALDHWLSGPEHEF